MNKQELIDRLKKLLTTPSEIEGSDYDYGHNYGIERAILLAEHLNEQQPQMNEPEKPTVPQYVEDWIEWCKRNSVTLLGAMSPIDELGTAICNDKKVKSLDASKWATQNQETFAKAWLFGYEVEKEKLYTVELPNPNEPDSGHIVLHKDEHNKVYIDWHYEDDWKLLKSLKLTESEIKQDFDWAWPFAKEVEE
jgi:hypothetical protein